ncbi:MAG: response regulator [Proteobacteria bacterium]|nr:response regulator [Pseudomonadota bacterium]
MDDLTKTKAQLIEELRALRESEKTHRSAIEQLGEGVCVCDPLERFILVNPSAGDIFGVQSEDLIGLSLLDFVSLEDRALVLEQTERRNKGVHNSYNLEIIRPDGQKRSIQVTVTPLIDDNLEYKGAIGIFRDITEQKRTEKRQLQQTQKMEAVGRLTGGIAHDLNNILGAIMSSVSVLELEIPKDNPIREEIQNIMDACRKGGNLTRNILGFARKGNYVKENLSLNRIVIRIMGLLKHTISKKVDIITELDDELGLVKGDRDQIESTLMNICINAADAMSGQGVLTISTKNVFLTESSDIITNGNIEPGRYVQMRVLDNGVGMNDETKERAFEPFFTTKPEGEGTGLGLSMVDSIVRSHGGTVIIDSELGIETTVAVFFPALDYSETRHSYQVDIGLPSTNPKSDCILVVDDDRLIRNSTRRSLETLGYDVIIASSGKEAREIYQENEETISLVVLDLIMPVMDGFEVFDELKGINPKAKILIFSGYYKDEKVDELLKKGASGFIQKPFDIRSLSDEVKKALNSSLSQCADCTPYDDGIIEG